MTDDSMDSYASEDSMYSEDLDGIYCPYTNGSECALSTKNFKKPRELCKSLECDQMKYFTRIAGRKRDREV